MLYVGLDLSRKRLDFDARLADGALFERGAVPPDGDGLAGLVRRLGDADVLAVIESMNGARLRLWKWELQKLADETGLDIAVCHFPPGTSKWNKIEHRLFAFISQNWQARPLISYKVIVQLIAATTTTTGLQVHCALDRRSYPKGLIVSDRDMATIRIAPDRFHGEWNYTISPRSTFAAIIP